MSGFAHKLTRHASRYVFNRALPVPSESIFSFGFDDCPRSVLETALPMLEAEGWRATIYVAMGLCGITNHLGQHLLRDDVKEIAARGHEIADHTYNHLSAHDVSTRSFIEDIDKNQAALADLGLSPSRHFAYPFGYVSPATKKALSDRFLTQRGVISPQNKKRDANLLTAMRLYSGQNTDAVLDRISGLKAQPEWLNIFSHDVRDTPSDFGCTPQDLAAVITKIKVTQTAVMTVGEAYEAITTNGSITS